MSTQFADPPKSSGIEPLFLPWEEPNKHRAKAKGGAAEIRNGRRPSPLPVVQNLRAEVSQWRSNGYPGTSDTTRELLAHWFGREHRLTNANGESYPFSYYFCQRESIETFIYLRECRSILNLSGLTEHFGAGSVEERFTAALGIAPDEDKWPRYAFKIATGAGKTKCMSLAIVWSYFHALRESDSPMAKHFVMIAPNLIVFERLQDDFANGKIFYNDPLVPVAWRGDFHPSVVLQDEIGGVDTAPIIYLTNIHRLYDLGKKRNRDDETYDWLGPAVSKATAMDVSKALRERITSHPRVLVLNDEAHHVWDPDSTWNECIEQIRDTIHSRTDNNLVAQLDFSATPKDNKGSLFKHVVCDAPLGEAIDGGIVKTPIIGTGKLHERTSENAADRYQHHLLLGYNRWLDSYQEWQGSGKKALMFVMTENAEASNEIAQELDTNPLFKELNGKTLNLHTRLKGKLVKKGKAPNVQYVFKESEKDISDDDLRYLRDLAKDLDEDTSQFRCIVSVLMLREGWDVRNVTTIVPLRAFSAKANILPEQTLGRGLRRMTPPGQANELVTVVEHPSFASIYQGELAQQGAFIDVVDVEKVPRTTTSIFPDGQNKDQEKLKLLIPTLTPGFTRSPKLDGLTIDDVKAAFQKYKPLPIGEKASTTIDYVGKHLITQEVIHQLTIELPSLMQVPSGCISFYRTELERHTKLTGLKHSLDNLLEKFVQEVLFEKPVSIFDEEMLSRFADDDVREHIRATFVPLIRERTTFKEERKGTEQIFNVTLWKPFQVAKSASRPVLQASKSPFNLVPCDNQFEAALCQFLDKAADVSAFCKNAGPQALRIDYLNASGQLALYTPDFIARTEDGKYFLIEGKGKEDKDVPLKARAALEWCKSASTKKTPWEYLYVSQALFQTFTSDKLSALARTAAPSLAELISEAPNQQLKLPLAELTAQVQKESEFEKFIAQELLDSLPSAYRTSIEQAITLFIFCQNQKDFAFASVFTPLLRPLDSASVTFLGNTMAKFVPTNPNDQKAFFDAGIGTRLHGQGQNLRKTLVYKSGLSPIGLLNFCMTFQNKEKLGGVFQAISKAFSPFQGSELADDILAINDFRNTYIAHQEIVLNDIPLARTNLKHWIETITKLYRLNHPAASVPINAAWFIAASKNLALIERNAADYDHPEEGDKAPSQEVFDAVRGFLKVVQNERVANLEEPRIFVSSNGQLVVNYGNTNKSIDLRFAPSLSFFFKHTEGPPVKGDRLSDAVQIVCKYFRI